MHGMWEFESYFKIGLGIIILFAYLLESKIELLNIISLALIPAVLTGIFTLLGVLLGTYLTQTSIDNRDEKSRKKLNLQNKKQIYSDLMGIKRSAIRTLGLFILAETQRLFLNCQYLCIATCESKINIDKTLSQNVWGKAQEIEKRSVDLIIKNINNEKDLWKAIGLVQTNFENSQKLKDSIINISSIEEKFFDFNGTIADETNEIINDIKKDITNLTSDNCAQWTQEKGEFITSWKNDRVKDATEQIYVLDSGIDDLLKCLKDQINAEESAVIG